MARLIETRGLTVGHDGQAVLSGIDLTVDRGRILCLLGPNGAGKTTLFRTLLGLIPPISGDLLLEGRAVTRADHARIPGLLAHVPQSLATPFDFTALDLVLMGAAARLGPFARPGRTERQRALSAMDSLGIAGLAGTAINRLSGGQRQMVLIARALAQDTPAIVMDEPTANLDFGNRLRVQTVVRDLTRRGIGVVLSTHDPDQAALIADTALLVGKGGPLGFGPAADILTARALSDLYGIPVARHEIAGHAPCFRADTARASACRSM